MCVEKRARAKLVANNQSSGFEHFATFEAAVRKLIRRICIQSICRIQSSYENQTMFQTLFSVVSVRLYNMHMSVNDLMYTVMYGAFWATMKKSTLWIFYFLWRCILIIIIIDAAFPPSMYVRSVEGLRSIQCSIICFYSFLAVAT